MKLALVTTPPSARSAIGDYTQSLVRELSKLCEVELFVERGREGTVADVGGFEGRATRSADTLVPRDFDQVLYQLGNDRQHAFMLPMLRALGGTVALHDWVLFDLAHAAFPALERGGWKGIALALREGGLSQAKTYSRSGRERRTNDERQRGGFDFADVRRARGVLLWGWHAAEPTGRWTCDVAGLRLPGKKCSGLRIDVTHERGRTLTVEADTHLDRIDFGEFDLRWLEKAAASAGVDERNQAVEQLERRVVEFEFPPCREPFAALFVSDVRVTPTQRARGDRRRLGCFVHALEFLCESGWISIDLSQPSAVSVPRPFGSEVARFQLPLNRSVVRLADSFIVHTEHVRHLIIEERNAPTPTGVVQHGAERAWRAEDRRIERERLALPPAFRDAFLLTSFGAVQEHKRIEVLLRALSLARKSRPSMRLALVGTLEREQFDPTALVQQLELGEVVHFTGYVDEALGRRYIHSGDLALQLRGPSTGGTSGGVFQSLAVGRGVIASDFAEQSELPSSCVLKLAPGDGEVERLAELLVELHDSPDRRAELERAARDFVERECHWSLVAAKYFDLLSRFPPPRTARKSLIALRIAAGARAKRSPAR